jgi:hypothetical protein
MNLKWRQEEEQLQRRYFSIPNITVDAWGSIIISGFYYHGDEKISSHSFVRKYEPGGQLEWENSYGGPNENFGTNSDLAIDATGHLAVVDLVATKDDSGIAVRKLSP